MDSSRWGINNNPTIRSTYTTHWRSRMVPPWSSSTTRMRVMDSPGHPSNAVNYWLPDMIARLLCGISRVRASLPFRTSNTTKRKSRYTLIQLIQDVCWHVTNPNIFASCSDDCSVAIMDIRSERPSIHFKPHEQEVNCIQFNPGHEHLFLTGSSDKSTKLFDFRKPDQELHAFEQHDDAIFCVQWALHD